jgi:two-component system cell cycle sensor histidine kinase PleC
MYRQLASLREAGKITEKPELAGSSIAIIDDLESNRSFLEHLAWRQPGVRYVMTFISAVAALKGFASTPPDLVITDFHMPEMNAVQFLEEFRKIPEYQDIPVIVISSQNEARNRHQALLSGATDFLMVPFDPLEFQARTHNLLTLSMHQKNLRKQSHTLRTELLETKHKSEVTQSRFTSIIDSVPALVFMVNRDGQIVFANQFCFELLGIPAERGLKELQFLADRIGTPEEHRSMGESLPPRELPLAGADGDEHVFLIVPKALEATEEGDWLTVYSGIEITQLKITETSLRQAKKLAEAANNAKSAFLSNMTHEIRTPLNAIIGFTEAIEKELYGPLGSDRYKEYLHDILVSARHLLTVANEILDFSQAEAQRQAVALSCFSLPDLMDEVCILTKLQIEAARNSITIGDVPYVDLQTDRQKLCHVLVSMLANANNATHGGSIKVAVNQLLPAGVAITISDDGIGMDKDELALAMGEFGRSVAPAFVSKGNIGTGLGLPVSIRLMQLIGGQLKIESEKGVGTTARITLPGCIVSRDASRGAACTTAQAGSG